MNKEDYIEKLLIKAYTQGKGKLVIDRAADLLSKGVDRINAFTLAYYTVFKEQNRNDDK
jgi:hypothetical protein